MKNLVTFNLLHSKSMSFPCLYPSKQAENLDQSGSWLCEHSRFSWWGAATYFMNIILYEFILYEYLRPKKRLPKPAGCGRQSSSIKEMNCKSFENRIIMSLTSIILSYIYFSGVSMIFIITLWTVAIAWDLPKW